MLQYFSFSCIPTMGKGCGIMDKNPKNYKKCDEKPNQLRQEAQLRAHMQRNAGASNVVEDRMSHLNVGDDSSTYENQPRLNHDSSQSGDISSRLVASTSSPSLLQGCSDSSTHVGAVVERHMLSHNVHVNIIPNSPVTPSPQPNLNPPSFPENPPDSVFLTPSPQIQRSRQSSVRPNSAPADHLERISGTLLRLVGDHYMCSTCGRQLRNIGDQMELEANIRRTFSTGHLNLSHDNETNND